MVVLTATTATVQSRLAPPTPDYREALVVAHRPLSLDPLLGRDDSAVRDVGGLLYHSLLRLDDRALPTADLVTSWGVSGDGLSYRFALPPSRRWSDGTRLTAADVLATVGLVQSPQYPDAGVATSWQGVRLSSDAISVTMTLSGPRASFPVTVTELPILPARVIAGRTVAELIRTQAMSMPTDGPFTVVSSDSTALRLGVNRWATPPPQLRSVELRLEPSFTAAIGALQQNQADGIEAVTPEERRQLTSLSHVTLHDITTFRFTDMLINERIPGLDDPVVRKALVGSVRRAQLIDGPLAGAARPESGAIPAGITWAQPPTGNDDQSPLVAGQTLDADGWVVGEDGVRHRDGRRLSFDLTVPSAPPLPAVGRALASQLEAVGIAVVVHDQPADQFEQNVLVPHAFQLAVADWQVDADPDISSFWRSNAQPPAGLNVTGAAVDPFLDQALDTLATASDVQLRQAAAARVGSQLAEGSPAAFLYAPTVTFAVSSELQGVDVPLTGGGAARFASITRWHRH